MEKEIKIFLAALVLLAGAFVFGLYFYDKKDSGSGVVDRQSIVENQRSNGAPQTNSEGQVIIVVTPKNISPGASVWEFEVVLDAHSIELDYDLTKNSALIDSAGNKYFPLGWEGDPPGGHHRKGVLKFQSLAGSRGPIKLEISDIAGVAKRDFIWKLE